ncbi:hypothetical protein IWZ01DRAFT_281585 [Phyllosticta capitalensis]
MRSNGFICAMSSASPVSLISSPSSLAAQSRSRIRSIAQPNKRRPVLATSFPLLSSSTSSTTLASRRFALPSVCFTCAGCANENFFKRARRHHRPWPVERRSLVFLGLPGMPALRGVAEQKKALKSPLPLACLLWGVVGHLKPFGTLPGLPSFELSATEWTAPARGMMARLVFFPRRHVSDFFMLCFTLPLDFLFARRFSSLRDPALDQSARVISFLGSIIKYLIVQLATKKKKKKRRKGSRHPIRPSPAISPAFPRWSSALLRSARCSDARLA